MKKRIYFLALFLVAFNIAQTQQIWHVNQQATGQSTGLNWQNAFTDLQQALGVAQYGDTIWVAQGIYKPTSDTDPTKTFNLVNGVALLGGFIGNEGSVLLRNPALHETILSGDIGQSGVKTDNSWHVLTGAGLDRKSILDGFTVKNGYAVEAFGNNPNENIGAGLYLIGSQSIEDSHPTVSNCIFIENTAYSGGGIGIDWIVIGNFGPDTNLVNLELRNCSFIRNKAVKLGGGLCKLGPVAPNDTLLWSHCAFMDNRGTGFSYGGGIALEQTGATSLRLLKCTFERDSALEGGGFYYSNQFEKQVTSNLMIDSCDFKYNNSLEDTGFSYYEVPGNNGLKVNISIQACTFEGNKAYSGEGASFGIRSSEYSTVNVDIGNCIVKKNRATSDRSGYINVFLGAIAKIFVHDCVFMDNIPTSESNNVFNFPLSISVGGAGLPSNVYTRVDNCLFAGNKGAIDVTTGPENQIFTEITNSTFYKNDLYPFVKTWWASFEAAGSIYYNRMLLRNCIIWEPLSTPATLFYSNDPINLNYQGMDVEKCLFNYKDSDLYNVVGAIFAISKDNLFATDPLFEFSDANDFRLKKCSPAVNYGDNQFAPQVPFPTDLNGLPRIRFGNIDLGAFETQDSCAMVAVSDLNQEGTLSLTPNPSTGSLNIDFSTISLESAKVYITRMDGTVVYSGAVQSNALLQLDLGWLTAGVYVVQICSERRVWSGKWVKN